MTIRAWLFTICLFLMAMIAIGGITRLTQSGLSIVEWAPIMGALPPLHEGQWQAAFDAYKAFPQYEKVFPQMNLSEFKWIYFWEYLHRLIGRSIGLVVFLPALYFLRKHQLPKGLLIRVLVGMGLGGLQGALGWYMVKSGLIDRPSVSHYRLASHFGLAIFILLYFQNLIFKYCPHSLFSTKSEAPAAPAFITFLKNSRPLVGRELNNPKRVLKFILIPLFCLQLIYGAFVAGMKAGWIYNTFPKMHDHWFPPEAVTLLPLWINFLDNGAAVQWVHRWLAFILVVFTTAWVFFTYIKLKKSTALLNHEFEILKTYLKQPLNYLIVSILAQYLLGAAMLVFHTPVLLGVLHQVLGVTLLLILFWTLSRIDSLSARL